MAACSTAPAASNRYFPIKELTTWTPRWVILGRVVDKGPVNSFRRQDGAAGKIGSVDIMDRDGDSIRAKFWGDAADKWIPYLQQGQIYSFSGGRVQVANKRFNNLSHSYELTFDVDAKIAPASSLDSSGVDADHTIPYLRKYNFTTLRDIHTSPRELPFLVDLLVVLKWISPTTERFTNRTTQDEGVRRLAQVVDDTGFQMALTFFGEHTELRIKDADAFQPGVILAIQNVQIREFRGRNGSTLRSTHIAVDPDIPEVEHLRTWLLSCDISSESFKSLSEGPVIGAGTLNNRSSEATADKQVTLEHIFKSLQTLAPFSSSLGQSDSASELFVVAPVEPTKLLYVNRSGEVTLLYPACPKCNRKVMRRDDEAEYRCEACNLTHSVPSYRFMFAMHLVDTSGSRFTARTFHDAGSVLVRTSVQQLAQWVPPRSLASDIPAEAREILEYDALWRKYRMGLRARRDVFGGEERVTVSVMFAEPLDYTGDARRLLNDIQSILSRENTRKRLPETAKHEDSAALRNLLPTHKKLKHEDNLGVAA